MALRFESTGFFRLEKADRWWLVTPEGDAFLSFGVNHIQPDRTTAPYNKAFWAKEFGYGRLIVAGTQRAGARPLRSPLPPPGSRSMSWPPRRGSVLRRSVARNRAAQSAASDALARRSVAYWSNAALAAARSNWSGFQSLIQPGFSSGANPQGSVPVSASSTSRQYP